MFRKTFSVLFLVLLVCGMVPCLVKAQVPSDANPSIPSQPSGTWTLSPLEIAIIAAIAIAVAGVVGFALYQRAQLRSIQKQTALLKAKTMELRARENQTVQESMNACKYCRTPIEENATFCPVCHRALR